MELSVIYVKYSSFPLFQFDIPSEQVDQVHSRPQPEVEKKPAPPAAESQPPAAKGQPPDSSKRAPEDMPTTSA